MINSEKIKKMAENLKIDICRITNTEKIDRNIKWLEDRIKKDYTTEFEEKDIDYRTDPLFLMEDCNSIIVIAISYNIQNGYEKKYPLKGNLSRSSWGTDYHIVLKEKMDQLVEEMNKINKFKHKSFVDTGPLIDRELAYKSGIGYYGKNCSIINPEYGSFIFIGYILTDLKLEFDKNIREECGNCNICLESCPTGALELPYKLNPKKCISYLTQTKENIPDEYRKKMGKKIYGCDTCQLVCPKNRDVTKSEREEFQPKITGGNFNIEELLSVSNREFKNKYGHISASWRGRNILKRNAIIALGNMKDEKNLHLLEDELDSQSKMIREYSEWAIGEIKNKIQR